MNQFTIRDIENLCGIKAHTLRIWEQRYQLCVAKRKQSQHRVYDNEDLKELLRVAYLYHNGHKISHIAELSAETIQELVEAACVQGNDQGVFVHQLIEAGIDLDKEKFEKIVNCLVQRIGLERSIREVIYPFLERIGLLWMTNNVVPAQEHFVSHIIRKKIILAIDGLEVDPSKAANILVFAPEGEHHEIPLLAINYFLRKYNNRTIYFGANISLEAVQYYQKVHPAEYIYIHVITHLGNQGLDSFFHSLSKAFPGKKIIASGPALNCLSKPVPHLEILHSLDELVEFAKEMGKGKPQRRGGAEEENRQ